MRIQELIYQHVFSSPSPTRFRMDEKLATIGLPDDRTSADVEDLVISLLYPKHTSASLKREYADSDDPRVAMLLTHSQQQYRLLRRKGPESFRLQIKEKHGFRTLVEGWEGVAQILNQRLRTAAFEQFWSLNLMRFARDPKMAGRLNPNTLAEPSRQVVENYQLAKRAEELGDKILSMDDRITSLRAKCGPGAVAAEKLGRLRSQLKKSELGEITDDDRRLLGARKEQSFEFRGELERLETESEDEASRLEGAIPKFWTKEKWFWFGLIMGAIPIVAVAIGDVGRGVALFDIPGFTLSMVVVLRYYTGRENAAKHQLRLDAINRKISRTREEATRFQQRVEHLLVHTGTENADQLELRLKKCDRLVETIASLDEKVQTLQSEPQFLAATKELAEKEEKMATLRQERDDIGAEGFSAYQLEMDLRDLGIDIKSLVVEDSAPDPQQAAMRLFSIAANCGQVIDGALAPPTHAMWSKICAHVLGTRFKDVWADKDGLCLRDVGPEKTLQWEETRNEEYQLTLFALALAILVNAADNPKALGVETVLTTDPRQVLSKSQAAQMEEVLKSASKKAHLVLCKYGARTNS
jgi:hypothetical protein